MTQQLINRRKWDRDDFRLLVVLLLVVVYPVFVSSFFALYVFVIMPLMVEDRYSITTPMHQVLQDGWYYAYWLFVSLLWLLSCAIILPCFQEEKKEKMPVFDMEMKGSPEFPTKANTVQPFANIEETNEKKRLSVLTEKSQGSYGSIRKSVCDEKADKESLEKSRESLATSGSLSERRKLVESGEFLNEYIDTLEHKEVKKLETDRVHTQKKNEGSTSDSTSSDDEIQNEGIHSKKDIEDKKLSKLEAECEVHTQKKNEESTSDSSSSEDEIENKGNHSIKGNKDKKDGSSDLSTDKEDATPKDSKKEREENDTEPVVTKNQKDKSLEAVPKMATCTAGETLSESIEVDDLEDSQNPDKEKKARLTIDTSGAQEQYECSMPTPTLACSGKRENNMVFLFVNPDTVDSEEGVKVVHAGEVEEEE